MVPVILLQIVYMVSPGTHLVNSQESLSISSESQLENKESLIENAWYGPFNQTVNLETDTKILITVY